MARAARRCLLPPLRAWVRSVRNTARRKRKEEEEEEEERTFLGLR